MANIYEYLFTGIIIVAMLIASISVVSSLSGPRQSESDKEYLQITAEKIMTHLLFDPGYPYDWGFNKTDPNIFGLAKYGQTSRQAYLLDSDKIMRLSNVTQSFYIKPETVSNLLNIGNEYGFTFRLKPTLDITINNPEAGIFEITVLSGQTNMPILGASVTAVLYYLPSESNTIHIGVPLPNQYLPAITDSNGNCSISFENVGTNTAILTVVVDYYGSQFNKIYPLNDSKVLNATIFAGKIVSSSPYTIYDNNATQIVATRQNAGFQIVSFNISNILSNEQDFELPFLQEPSTIAVLAISDDKLLCAFQDLEIQYSTLNNIEATNFANSPLSYSLERIVFIDETAYSANLFFWRMSL